MYDSNGYIEIDPERCGYSSFLGAAVPEAVVEEEDVGEDEELDEASDGRREASKRRQKQK